MSDSKIPKRRARAKSSALHTPEQVAAFRLELEQLIAPIFDTTSDAALRLIAQVVDLLCRAYERGGLAESERTLERINKMLADDEAMGEV